MWRILVGGTKLSRGFTVEGLTISYFRRKAGQADTLMHEQVDGSRFREGYSDLVRLYIRRRTRRSIYTKRSKPCSSTRKHSATNSGKYAGLDRGREATR